MAETLAKPFRSAGGCLYCPCVGCGRWLLGGSEQGATGGMPVRHTLLGPEKTSVPWWGVWFFGAKVIAVLIGIPSGFSGLVSVGGWWLVVG